MIRVVQAVLFVNQGLDFIIEAAEQHTDGRDHNSLQQILVLGQQSFLNRWLELVIENLGIVVKSAGRILVLWMTYEAGPRAELG